LWENRGINGRQKLSPEQTGPHCFILTVRMNRCLVTVPLALVFQLPTLYAIEKQYQTGKIVEV